MIAPQNRRSFTTLPATVRRVIDSRSTPVPHVANRLSTLYRRISSRYTQIIHSFPVRKSKATERPTQESAYCRPPFDLQPGPGTADRQQYIGDTRSAGCTGYKKRIRTDYIKKRVESSDTAIISGKHGDAPEARRRLLLPLAENVTKYSKTDCGHRAPHPAE